jgi:antitoxin component YwqK of YwqJK toxin-antitoxin module
MINFSLTKNAIILIVSVFTLLISSCTPGDEKAAETPSKGTGDLANMVMEPIPGTSKQYARQMDAVGNVEIEGFVEDGKKTGMWVQYTPEGDIALINHYVNGLMEGTSMRMSFRNQVDLKLNYKQGKLDGPWTAYKFGKVIEQRFYVNDKLEGTAKTYDDRSYKLKQEVQYKNGVQDGFFKYYDEDGNVTLEYEYKNGEKVSGGMVEPQN